MAKAVTDCALDDSHTLYESSNDNTVPQSDFIPAAEDDNSLDFFDSDCSGHNNDDDDDDSIVTMLSRHNADSKDHDALPSAMPVFSCSSNEPLNLSVEPANSPKSWQNQKHRNLCFVDELAEFSPAYLKEARRSDDDILDSPPYDRDCGDTDGNESGGPVDKCWDGDSFIYSDGKKISALCPKCTDCGNRIHDPYIWQIQGKAWHGDCLKCSECSLQLSGKCYLKGNKVYCKDDFFKLYGRKCVICNKGIPPSEAVRKADQYVYHLDCFKCFLCLYKLKTGDEYYLLSDKRLVCKKDYEYAKSKEAEGDGGMKRPRTTINAAQLKTLREAYEQSPKPARHVREKLSAETGLDMRVVQVWFQNRRAKEKRIKNDNTRHLRGFPRGQIQDGDCGMDNAQELSNCAQFRHPGDHGESPQLQPDLLQYNHNHTDAEFSRPNAETQFEGGNDELDGQNEDYVVYLDSEQLEQPQQYHMRASHAGRNNFAQYYHPSSFLPLMNTVPMLPNVAQAPMMTQMQAVNTAPTELDVGSNSSGQSASISDFSASPSSWIADIEHVPHPHQF